MPFLLALIPGGWRIALIGGLIVGAIAFCSYEEVRLIHEGEQKERQEIDDANKVEQRNAAAGSAIVDGCYADGGTWDRANGVCVGATR